MLIVPPSPTLPLIDISPFLSPHPDPAQKALTAKAVDEACSSVGFFYLVGHGLSEEQVGRLHQLAREFFALSDAGTLKCL